MDAFGFLDDCNGNYWFGLAFELLIRIKALTRHPWLLWKLLDRIARGENNLAGSSETAIGQLDALMLKILDYFGHNRFFLGLS